MRSKLTITITIIIVVCLLVILAIFFLKGGFRAETITDDPVEVKLSLIDESTKTALTNSEAIKIYISDSTLNSTNSSLEFPISKESQTMLSLPSPAFNLVTIQAPGYKTVTATAYWQGSTRNPRTMKGTIALTPGEGFETLHLFVFERGFKNQFSLPFTTLEEHASETMSFYHEAKETYEKTNLDLSGGKLVRYKTDSNQSESWSTENDFRLEAGRAYMLNVPADAPNYEDAIVAFKSPDSSAEFFQPIALKKNIPIYIGLANSSNISADDLIFGYQGESKKYGDALGGWLTEEIKIADPTKKFGTEVLKIGASSKPYFSNQILPGWVVYAIAKVDGLTVTRETPLNESDFKQGVVWGSLKNEAGNPMANINISIGVLTAKSDQNGRYSVYPLMLGSYPVRFFDDEGKRYVEKDAFSASIAVYGGASETQDYILIPDV